MCEVNGLRIIPSYKCNFDCSFCYQKERSNGNQLPTDLLKEKLINLKNSGFKPIYITFMGGEFSILENSLEYLDIVNKVFPLSRKMITTNGSAEIGYYDKLRMCGISHITFSINDIFSFYGDSIRRKIESLNTGFYTIRINTFLNEEKIEDMRQILIYAVTHDIQLTFCIDVRNNSFQDVMEYVKSQFNTTNVKNKIDAILDKSIYKPIYDWDIQEYPNYYIFKNYEIPFVFWVFHHKENYKNDNYIILPNGEITCNFNKVVDCHGKN